jgi:hypothetical protein
MLSLSPIIGFPKATKDVAFDSSVGRAWDCNGYIVRSRGHWFDPGSKDFFSYGVVELFHPR